MKNKPPTENTGASIERACIKRHVKNLRTKRPYIYDITAVNALSNVIKFIDSRTKRTAKRKGGLGKR